MSNNYQAKQPSKFETIRDFFLYEKYKNLFITYFTPDTISTFGIFFIIGLYIGLRIEKNLLLEALAVTALCSLLSFFLVTNPKIDQIIISLLIISNGIIVANIRKPVNQDIYEIEKLSCIKSTLIGSCKGNIKYSDTLNELQFELEQCKVIIDNQEYLLPKNVLVKLKNTNLIPIPANFYELSGKLKISNYHKELIFIADIMQEKAYLSNYLSKLISQLRMYIYDKFQAYLPNRIFEYTVAFAFGDTSLLSRKDKEITFKTGMSHVMAVSGQHIGILVIFLASVLAWIKIPPISRAILIFISLMTYALISTGSASIWRAIIIYTFYVITYHLEAIPKPIKAIIIAAIVLLLFNPYYLFSASFQLSFAAVLGIIYINEDIFRLLYRLKIPCLLAKYISISWSANLATIPISIYHFGTFPLISFIANPCLIWMFSIILPMTLIFPFVCLLNDTLAVIFSSGLVIITNFFILSLEIFANLPFATITVKNIPSPVIFLIYGLMLFIFTPAKFWNLFINLFKNSNENNLRNVIEIVLNTKNKVFTNNQTKAFNPINALTSETSHITSIYHSKELNSNSTENIYSLSKSHYKLTYIKDYQEKKLYENQHLLNYLETYLLQLPKRSLKGGLKPENLAIIPFDTKKLSFENQNILNRLEDLDSKVLENETYRLLQAYILLTALLSNIFLSKVTKYLNFQHFLNEIKINFSPKSQYIYAIMILEFSLNHNIIRHITNTNVLECYKRIKELFPFIICKIITILNSFNTTQPSSNNQNLIKLNGEEEEKIKQELADFFSIKSNVYKIISKLVEL